jgi:5-methylcytosine-specific restriction endonuclease McrA
MGQRSNTFGRDYNWDSHTPDRSTTVYEIHGHEVVDGSPDDYQTLGSRLVHPRPPAGYTIRSTCTIPHCVTHAQPVPPLRPSYPPGVCVYCGWPADTQDHILPKSWTGDAARSRTVTVPSCRECNSAINDTYAPTIAARRAIAHSHIRRRYSKYLTAIMYGPSDLAAMGHTLRTAAVARMNGHEATMARLAWPHDPFYDARALADIPEV